MLSLNTPQSARHQYLQVRYGGIDGVALDSDKGMLAVLIRGTVLAVRE